MTAAEPTSATITAAPPVAAHKGKEGRKDRAGHAHPDINATEEAHHDPAA